jgi:Na+/phosphate symporter
MYDPDLHPSPQPLVAITAPDPEHPPKPQLHIRVRVVLPRIGAALSGLALFVLALELLKTGAASYGQTLITLLNITTPVNTLGFGWLLAYIFLSGSPVAAVAVSFFAAGVIDAMQTFTMITGSRLGASFIVLFVGFLYYLRGNQRVASISIGVLALLTTAAIYLPALVLGAWWLNSPWFREFTVTANAPLRAFFEPLLDPLVATLQAALPEWALLIGGALLLLLAFALLDRALPNLDTQHSALQIIGRVMQHPLAMFMLGAAITSITLSVSVSLSILVPLAARGLVRRENSVPYIMGANITTFIDTLIAALIVGGPAAFTIVLIEMLSVTVISLLVLLFAYRSFERTMLRTQQWITSSNQTLAIFLGIILLIPLLLLTF